MQNFSGSLFTFDFFRRSLYKENVNKKIAVIKTFTSMSHVNRSFKWGRTLGKIVNGEKSGFKQKSTYLITILYRDRLCCFVYLVLHIVYRLIYVACQFAFSHQIGSTKKWHNWVLNSIISIRW